MTTEETRETLDRLYNEWVSSDCEPEALGSWACARFGTTIREITRETMLAGVEARKQELKELFVRVRECTELRDDGMVRERVARIAKVMREARNAVEVYATLYYQKDDTRQMTLPDAWDPDSYYQHMEADEKMTTFQRLLCVVLKKLAADGLRRMADEVWEPVIVEGSHEFTHAWRRLMTIREYIYDRVQKESGYEEWKCLTNPHDNGDRVVCHLQYSTQSEFPAIKMNRYLWAYDNGLYNVRDDMFWPFAACQLETLADVSVEAVARLPPQEVDGVPNEAAAQLRNGVLVWHVQDGRLLPESFFKVGSTYYLNHCGRDDWDEMGARIQAFRRGLHFGSLNEVSEAAVRRLPVVGDAGLRARLGEPVLTAEGVCVWNVRAGGELGADAVLECDGLLRGNDNGREVWTRPDGKPYTAEKPGAQDVAVRHFDLAFRYAITPETEAHFDPTAIELPAMEKIMNVQELSADTQQWLVLMLCRLFFPVGYDRWQVVLFIRGIAGSGKSTLA